jgi:predicted ATP-dependent serine protease
MTMSKNPLPPGEVIPEQEPQNQQYNGKVEQGFMRISTGVTGLDEILYGGFIQKRAYLLRGGSGCGKTTLGLHFLTKGTTQGECSLFTRGAHHLAAGGRVAHPSPVEDGG